MAISVNVSTGHSTTKPSRDERKASKKAAKKAERKAAKKAVSEVTHTQYATEGRRQVHIETAERRITSESEQHAVVQHQVDMEGNYIAITKQHFADRIIAIPEIVQREVVEEAFVSVPRHVEEREKIIRIREVVEIPEIEYIDEYITEEYTQDVHRTIEKPVSVEKIVEHIIHVDDVETINVEVPEIMYEDVVVVKDVPVPTIVEKEVVREVIVPQIHEELIEDINYVYQDREVRRNIPVPVEATIKQKFIAPRIVPVHKERSYKVLLPEFTEQAIWSSCITDEGKMALPSFQNRIDQLAGSSLCEVEKLFCDIKAIKMENEDWLSTDMIRTHVNIPYMGVEKINIHKPRFVNSSHMTTSHGPEVHSTAAHQATKSSKSKLCKPKSKGSNVVPAPTTHAVQHQAQFVQVDSHLGHTTISPTARYAKRSIVAHH